MKKFLYLVGFFALLLVAHAWLQSQCVAKGMAGALLSSATTTPYLSLAVLLLTLACRMVLFFVLPSVAIYLLAHDTLKRITT
ncbi:MAG: hypothetical protein KBF88_16445 [Polyangiaceae bacterium]|nr:hypothetical protein [Polyangiaceae bacterium]